MPNPLLRLWIAICVFALCLGAAVPGWLDEEPQVYRSFLESTLGSDATAIAIASAPSRCPMAYRTGFDAALLHSFERANHQGAALAELSSLKDLASIANSRWLLSLNNQPLGPIGPQALPLVRFSRVGFAGNKALLCVRGPYGGWKLAQFNKRDGTWHLQASSGLITSTVAAKHAA